MSKFFVVGDVTVDLMYFVDELPDAGGDVTVSKSLMEPGGAGGTIAVTLARLGHQVKIATRVGTGPFSEVALGNIVATGVDTTHIQRDATIQTGSVILLITPDAQRTMISSVGASRNLDETKLQPEAVTACDALVMSAYSLVGGSQRKYALEALELAKKANLTTFIDMGPGAVNALQDELIDLVQDVDYLLMNQKELFALTGETSISDAIAGLKEQGINRVIVKVGEKGSIVITPELTELIEAFEIEGVIDTTGAGDYYTAAFAHGIMQGYDLQYAARLGNVAGAINTTQIGAQTAKVDTATLERFVEQMLPVES
jgi:ribokinase